MNRYLLGTTAFVTTSVVASVAMAQSLDDRVRTLEESMLMGASDTGFDITVSGFMQGGITVQNTDPVNENVHYASTDVRMGGAEIIFNATTVFDNGIRIGGAVQLEGFTERDQIDETYIWLEGGFGRFVLGAENGASSLLHFSSPWLALNGVDGGSYRYTVKTAVRTGTGTDFSGDANKITYFTPRIQGFQFGISWTPDNDNRGGEANGSGVREHVRDGALLENIVSLGGNFRRSFGRQLGVGLSAGWERGSTRFTYEAGPSYDIFFFGDHFRYASYDPTNWHMGGEVRMHGFTVGGAYFHGEGFTRHANTDATFVVQAVDISGMPFAFERRRYDLSDRLEQSAWTIGARYRTGPWGVGIGYFQAEGRGYAPRTVALRPEDEYYNVHQFSLTNVDTIPSVEPKTSTIGITAYYRLGRGVTIAADLGFYRDDDGLGEEYSKVESVGGGILFGINF